MFSRLGVFPYVLRRFSTRLTIAVDAEGNTPLHHAIVQCDSVQAFQAIVTQHGHEHVAQMSRTFNFEGELPIDRATDDAFALGGYAETLFPMMQTAHVRTLDRPLSVESVLQEHGDDDNPALNHHLVAGTVLVNYVRGKLKTSTSYPWFDPYLPESGSIMKRLDDGRKKFSQWIVKNSTTAKYSKHDISKKAELTLRYQVGNCEEFSCIALQTLLTHPFYGISGELAIVEPGDHAFVVLGRSPASRTSDFNSWGRSAVVCDPWVGEVYPVKKFEVYGRDYRFYDDTMRQQVWHVFPYYNPRYHRVVTVSERIKGGSAREQHGFFKANKSVEDVIDCTIQPPHP